MAAAFVPGVEGTVDQLGLMADSLAFVDRQA
jgi:hypothetical protein